MHICSRASESFFVALIVEASLLVHRHFKTHLHMRARATRTSPETFSMLIIQTRRGNPISARLKGQKGYV